MPRRNASSLIARSGCGLAETSGAIIRSASAQRHGEMLGIDHHQIRSGRCQAFALLANSGMELLAPA